MPERVTLTLLKGFGKNLLLPLSEECISMVYDINFACKAIFALATAAELETLHGFRS